MLVGGGGGRGGGGFIRDSLAEREWRSGLSGQDNPWLRVWDEGSIGRSLDAAIAGGGGGGKRVAEEMQMRRGGEVGMVWVVMVVVVVVLGAGGMPMVAAVELLPVREVDCGREPWRLVPPSPARRHRCCAQPRLPEPHKPCASMWLAGWLAGWGVVAAEVGGRSEEGFLAGVNVCGS